MGVTAISLGASDALFQTLNGLAGRSWALDTLIGLSLENLLVKAGPIGACFIYAWRRAGSGADVRRRRGILLVTLLSLLAVAPVSKALSERIIAPRPFLLSERTFVLAEDQLLESRRIAYRTPDAGLMSERMEDLRAGKVDNNDLGTFPSDHAAFFTALALGILLASRGAGLIALAWALFVTLGSRVVVGLHSPLDIAAGAAIGAIVLGLLQATLGRWGSKLLDPVAEWTQRHDSLASAILFIILIEAANTMQTLKNVVDLARNVAERLL